MRIKPRTQILDVWHSLPKASHGPGERWEWPDSGWPDALSDAEQLLCLLHPMNEIEAFGLSDPDTIPTDVAAALAGLGVFRRIPRSVVDIAMGYFARHTTADGEPRFHSGRSLRPADPGGPGATDEQQRTLELVDSYSMSVTLCLAVLAFVSAREPLESSNDYRAKLKSLGSSASLRLTAAMIGLLRSFVVSAVDADSHPGRVMLDRLRHGQPQLSDEALRNRVSTRFGLLRDRLNSDVRLGVPEDAKPEEDQLFECGWTWGVAADAGPVGEDFVKLGITVSPGVADIRPHLYFTMVALDGIVDLFARRTRALNVLDPVQQRLAEALQIRWDLTQRYWSTMARFDRDSWPLEDIPWCTSDGEESDYYSLLVTSVLLQDLMNRTASDYDIDKAIAILEELAARGRVTRRMGANDPALALHTSGVPMRLNGSDRGGPLLARYAADFTPLLMKRACQAVQLTNDAQARERLMDVAQAAMEQLAGRQIVTGEASGLWDDVSRLTSQAGGPATTEPSWDVTERVVEALVTAALAYGLEPSRSDGMAGHLMQVLNEADHLYNKQLMASDVNDRSPLRTGLESIEQLIAQARHLQYRQTGTAVALANEALLQLNALAQSGLDSRRGH